MEKELITSDQCNYLLTCNNIFQNANSSQRHKQSIKGKIV